MQENDKLEFKREINNTFVKEVIAFANATGGTIIIGYDDNGKIYGVSDARKKLDSLCNMLHDSIEPNIDFFISPRIENEDGKDIIIVEVLQGTNKPYYIKSKGMTSSGVYIRVGATSQPASRDTIRDMIVESSGVSYEKNISNNQNLTFMYTEKFFKDKEIAFGDKEKKFLGLINENKQYTNLALLLSDQCPYTIKMAVYTDTTKNEFVDRKETNVGSVLQQLEEANNYLRLNNKVGGKIQGLERIDTYDYSQDSIREILLNSITHRNYEIPGSTLVHIFTDRIEFLSLGGLVKGITLEDIKLGTSSSRNPRLVSIFHRLDLVEAYGSGIPRMLDAYKTSTTCPEIKIGPNSFLVIMPKLLMKEEYQKIIKFLQENEKLTREDVETLLNVKKSSAVTVLSELINRNIIIKDGKGKNIIYKLK